MLSSKLEIPSEPTLFYIQIDSYSMMSKSLSIPKNIAWRAKKHICQVVVKYEMYVMEE
jgi:hypothetical protein